MDNISKKLINWWDGDPQAPEEVQIYLTNKCNLKCIFCCQTLGEYDISQDIQKEIWISLAHELCDIGVKKVLISGGGEPLIVKDTLLEMIRIFKLKNIKGRMINNGTLWDSDSITSVIKLGWDNITFSIDGPDAETHDYLRGVSGCFNKIVQNIKLFNKLKLKMKKEHPFLCISMVITKHNYKKIEDMVRLAYSLKIAHLNFEPVCVNNNDVEKMKLNPKERKEFMEHIIPKAFKLADKLNISTNLDRLIKIKYIEKAGKMDELILKTNDFDTKNHELTSLQCFEPWLWPKIEANGEVWPCSTNPLKENIKDKPFKEIWEGHAFKELRNKIKRGSLSEDCKNCVVTHFEINNNIREKLKEDLSKNEN